MTKIEEAGIYNYFKEINKINKKVMNLNCNLEILENIEKSKYLNTDNKKRLIKIEDNLKKLIKKNGLNYRVDKFILYSEEKILSYLIGIKENNEIIAIETDFKNEPILIFSNVESYINDNFNTKNMMNYGVILTGKNMTGKYKNLISIRTIAFMDTIGVYQNIKEFANNIREEFPEQEIKLKKNSNEILNKYSTMAHEMIIKNKNECIYKNKITDEEFILNTEIIESIEKYFKNENEFMEFILRKQIEEKPELTKREIEKYAKLFFKFNKCFEMEEDALNIIEN